MQLVKGRFNASNIMVKVAFAYQLSNWLDGFYKVRAYDSS